MAKISKLPQEYRIKITRSEVKEIADRLQTISVRDGQPEFSVAETKAAKKLLKNHGIGKIKMDRYSINMFYLTLAKECGRSEHPPTSREAPALCEPKRDIILHASQSFARSSSYMFTIEDEAH